MARKEQEATSQFNARSDRAAQSLRQSLQQKGANIPDSRAVEVGSDGRPPAPLPPEGSYARQAIDVQRRQAQQRVDPQQDLEGSDDIKMQRQDPQATLQSDNGNQSTSPNSSPEEQTQLSANAQRRISQLAEDLRRKDQEFQQLLESSKKEKDTLVELQSKLEGLESQHRQLLEQSLANMDPDTRAQVLLDGRLTEAIAASEQRLMNQILPHLQKIDRQGIDAEMRRLSSIYPGFNIDMHGPLIDAFRKGNPRCSVEQAFRAVAEPEELQLAPQVRASAVPPVVQPGNGRVQSRWNDDQVKSNPEQELVDEAAQLKKLMHSTDPADKAKQARFLHQHLSNRLDKILPR